MDYNVLLFIGFIEAVLCFDVMSLSTMRIKQPVKRNIAFGLCTMLLIISVFFLLLLVFGSRVVERYAMAITLTLALTWYYICSADTFFVSLFQFLSFINLYIAIGYMSDVLTVDHSGVAYQVEYVIIRLALYLVTIPLLFKYVRPRFRQLVDHLDKEWSLAAILPGIFLPVQTLLLYYPKPYWSTNKGDLWTLCVAALLYGLFFAVYYLFYVQATTIIEKNRIEKRELLILQQNKLWEAEFERRKETDEIIRQQQHDMKYHNNVITGLLHDGDIAQLRTYMNDFTTSFEENSANRFSANPVLNSICSHYQKCAEDHAIQIRFQLLVPAHIKTINNIDLTCILGNLLENALEGCNRLPVAQYKEIQVNVKYIKQRLRLQVKNSCGSDLVFHDDLPLTQKESGGTGIKSILYTAEKYDGDVSFSAVNGEFTATVLLNDVLEAGPSERA